VRKKQRRARACLSGEPARQKGASVMKLPARDQRNGTLLTCAGWGAERNKEKTTECKRLQQRDEDESRWSLSRGWTKVDKRREECLLCELRRVIYSFALRNSSFAMFSLCTSSGPSARRSVRALAHIHARGVSWHTPCAPCAWMALSITCSAMVGAFTLMAPI